MERKVNWKYEIGQRIKDNKRDITIIDRKLVKNKNGYNKKYYKYKCNKCGFDCGEHYNLRYKEFKEELFTREDHINIKCGCACCCSSTTIVVKGINDIVTTSPEMIKYFVNKKDMYTHTSTSGEKVLCKCPNCGYEKEIIVKNLYKQGFSCNVCSDGISIGNKIMTNVLQQLKENNLIKDFETEYSPNWCTYYNPYKQKETFGRYDFYIPEKQLIIEMDGKQHIDQNNLGKWDTTLQEQKYIDSIKNKLCEHNDLKIIRIRCDKSNFNYIKNNIINSELNNFFDLNIINWNYLLEKSSSTIIKDLVKDYNLNISIKELSNKYKICRDTVIKYLKIGNELKWCSY